MKKRDDPITAAEVYASYGQNFEAGQVLRDAADRDPSQAEKYRQRIAELEKRPKGETMRERWVQHFRAAMLVVFLFMVFGSVWGSPSLSVAGTLVLVGMGLAVWWVRFCGDLPGDISRHAAVVLTRSYIVDFPPIRIPTARLSTRNAITAALLALALLSSGALLCSVLFDGISADLFSYFPCRRQRCDMLTPSPWTIALAGLGLIVLGLSCVAYFFSDRVGGVLFMLAFVPVGVACMRLHAFEWGRAGDVMRVGTAGLFVAAMVAGAVWVGRVWSRARDTG